MNSNLKSYGHEGNSGKQNKSDVGKNKNARCFKTIKRSNRARFHKLTSVFHASVLLLIINFVITLSK